VDEYLSEKEQIEQIRQWWRENGWYLVGGALLAGIGYFGYDQYQAYQNRRAEEAAALYMQLQQDLEDDRPGTDELLARLTSEYEGSPYTDQARLLLARERLVLDPERARAELRQVVDSSRDPGLVMIARLRLARVLAYQERYDDALAVIDVEDPGQFLARLSEIRGDIYAAQGEIQLARAAYTGALTGAGAEYLDRDFLQMKLADLESAARSVPASEAGE
jgi:predicted negative regulator of RcsB-dependent stress response